MFTNKDVKLRGTELIISLLVQGLETSSALDGKTLIIGGETYTPKDLAKSLNLLGVVFEEARTARETARDKVAARRTAEPGAKSFAKLASAAIAAAIGDGSQAELSKFGIKVRTQRTLTAEEKAAKSEKARLTRERKKQALAASEAPVTPAPRAQSPKVA